MISKVDNIYSTIAFSGIWININYFSSKEPVVHSLCFSGPRISIASIQLCLGHVKAVIETDQQVNTAVSYKIVFTTDAFGT